MDKIFRIEMTLSGELAELYAALMAEFEEKSDIPLVEMNRHLLQWGVIQQLTMMCGLGLLDPQKAVLLEKQVDRAARDTLFGELVELARNYWKDSASGRISSIDLNQ